MAMALPVRGPIAPTAEEQRDIESVHRQICRANVPKTARLIGPEDQVLPLPPSLYRVLQAAVEVLNRGQAVSVVPIHRELTTREAADLLNVSRQYLVRLLEKGEIPYSKAGTHRRVQFDDLMEFERRRQALREQKLDELTRLSEELGLY